MDRSDVGATYTGLAFASSGGQNFLYATDDGPNRRVDMSINGQVWVTYTALNKGQGGFVDVFAQDGTLVKHFAVHGPLHSPWGIALAPDNFGPMSNAILITNNTPRGASTLSMLPLGLSLVRFETRIISPSRLMTSGRFNLAWAAARTAQPTSFFSQQARTAMRAACSVWSQSENSGDFGRPSHRFFEVGCRRRLALFPTDFSKQKRQRNAETAFALTRAPQRTLL